MHHGSHKIKTARNNMQGNALLAALMSLAFGAQVQAQTPPAAGAPETILVTGFRSSLQTSLAAKRKDDSIVDVIKAEDIGKFPDNNLSEALQRIPGVAIDRDGGEGRTITVRGLGPQFTRINLNGMEALATSGGRDSSGGTNRDRGFDFNVFAAELFSSITVRKTPSAEIEEGSLGATVDLATPRPFDFKGLAMAGQLQGQYNDLSKKKNDRETFLVSNRSADGKFGALMSVAFSRNNKIEEGPSTTRWENGSTAALTSASRFKSVSTDGGVTFTPIPTAAVAGTTNAGTLADLTGPALDVTKALHPRIPRYGHIIYDESRLGMTGSLQFKPIKGTLITLDGMHSDFTANRNEQYLEALSFSRSGQGTPQSSVYNYTINPNGELSKASFNGIDMRSENRHDQLESIFNQLNMTVEQNVGEKLRLKLFIGGSNSVQANPEQTTLSLDAYDVQGYSYDYTSPNAPVFNYGKVAGCTVDQACYWNVSSSTAKGDASLIRVRPNQTNNIFKTDKLDAVYDLTDNYKLKVGLEVKGFEFHTNEFRRSTTAFGENITAPAAALLNANLAKYVSVQSLAGGQQPWMIPNFDAIKSALKFDCNCIDAAGNDWTQSNTAGGSRGSNQDAEEKDKAAYTQMDFQQNMGGLTFRGNVGVRFLRTNQSTTGYTSATTRATIKQEYTDRLPSLNVAIEPIKNVMVRFASSKTMSRPLLSALTPGGTINYTARTFTGGNPFLKPIRSTNYDLNLEWYQDKDSMFSVGYFFKKMKTAIQTLSHTDTYGNLGYDLALGTPFGVTADTPFLVSSPVSTPGGLVRGYEVNLQKTFSFLPAPFNNFGGVLNYTHVDSQIAYYLSTTATTTTTANLLGMSPSQYNATLYYESSKFSSRVSAAYRSKYNSLLKPGNNADFQGKNSTLNVDAQASYSIHKNLTLTLQGLNLTDQYDDKFDAYNSSTFGNVDNNAPLDYVHTGRSYILGVRYKY